MNANSNDNVWNHIDEFLKQERDSIFAMQTHLRLALGAGALIAILLSASSFVIPLAAYLEPLDLSHSPSSRILLVSLGVTAFSVLVLVLAALGKLNIALRRALQSDLRNRIDAVRDAAERTKIDIPPKTANLLTSLEMLDK